MRKFNGKPPNPYLHLLVMGVGLVLFIGLLYLLNFLVVPFAVSLMITLVLQPVINFFEYRGINTRLIVGLILISLISLLVWGVANIIPLIFHQIKEISERLPEYTLLLKEKLIIMEFYLNSKVPQVVWAEHLHFLTDKFSQLGQEFFKALPQLLSKVFSFFTGLVLVPFMTFFMLVQGDLAKKKIIELVPNQYFEIVLTLFYRIEKQLGNFIRGMILDIGMVSILAIIGLSLIEFKYAFLIGAIAGVANAIPYVGPLVGAVPAIFITFIDTNSAYQVLLVSLVFVVVQFLDNNIVYPLAVGKSVDLPPLFIIIGLIVGGHFFGILGLLFSIPILSILKVTIEVFYTGMRFHRLSD